MSLLIKNGIRFWFVLTSRDRANQQALRFLDQYVKLAKNLNSEDGSRPIKVPPMRGVDDDMRKWSFFMILEHNVIVCNSISATIRQLARDETLSGLAAIDPKKDVMPTSSAGEDNISRLQKSVYDHLDMMKGLGKLRGTKTSPHPLFGDFDAHKWHCMFSFDLNVHLKQAEYVARKVS
jgi:hypothetical protein